MSEEEKAEQYVRHRAIYNDLKRRGHILFETVIGSQAHGTSTPQSDVDIAFVYMAPLEWLYARRNYHEHLRLSKDSVGYEIEHFLGLMATNNPSAMEPLFVPDDCIVISSPAHKELVRIRDGFITKKAKNSFFGYAEAQIRKAKGMEKFQNWSAERTKKKEPIDFCWVIQKDTNYGTVPLKEFMDWNGMSERNIGLTSVDHAPNTYALFIAERDDDFKGIFGENSDQVLFSSIPKGREVDVLMVYNPDAYKMHNTDWKRYTEWKKNTNRDRWVETEDGSFIDAKNIMHLVRLIQMNREIAEGKGCVVRRPNREELLSIRNGEKNLDEIIDWAAKEKVVITKLYDESPLRPEVTADYVTLVLLLLREWFYKMDDDERINSIIFHDNKFLQTPEGFRTGVLPAP